MPQDEYVSFNVSPQEFDTILAALRLWQRDASHIADGDGALLSIASEHGEALTNLEIDYLIDRIN